MKSLILVALVAVAVVLVPCGRPAWATILTIEVEGVVDSVSTSGGVALDSSVVIGSTMSGYCTYDTDTPDLLPHDYFFGEYELISISMIVGNYTFTHNPMSPDDPAFRVAVGNHVYFAGSDSSRFDGTITVNGSPKTYDDMTWGLTHLNLLKVGSEEYITSDDLPTSLPDFSVFDMYREFRVFFYEPFDAGDAGLDISGEITSITLIPEPATILLLGLGGVILLRRRKS